MRWFISSASLSSMVRKGAIKVYCQSWYNLN